MTALSAAYDNIRLLRRKIAIAEEELDALSAGNKRDASMIYMSNLTKDLVRALHDFADMGYEEDVARSISAPMAGYLRAHSS